jgi:DNA-binding PadR family transcriptional regulator
LIKIYLVSDLDKLVTFLPLIRTLKPQMKFQDIYQFFQDPPPIYLEKEVAVCYVLAILLKKGRSYGVELISHIETAYPLYRLSDTLLYSALKFLEDEEILDWYWQKMDRRGRPRRIYVIKESKIDLAKQFARLWYHYLHQNNQGNIETQKRTVR